MLRCLGCPAPSDTMYTCVDLDWMVHRLVERVPSGQVFIFLDACRYNAMDGTFKSRYTHWLCIGGWVFGCISCWDAGVQSLCVCVCVCVCVLQEYGDRRRGRGLGWWTVFQGIGGHSA
jgi:hypothetical protein